MLIVIHILIQLGLLVRVLLRPNRDPASRIAWAVVVLALPVAGILSYLLLGETNVGKRRRQRLQQVLAGLPDVSAVAGMEAAVRPAIPDHRQCLFDVGRSISGYGPLGGNQGTLMDNTNLAIDRMVEDIDAATHHVHILFYIWLPDRNGTKVADAVMRAAARGVTCRVMVDDLGSRRLIRSDLWARMGQAGAKLGRTLQIGNPLLRVITGRIDLRNHRKITVIDNRITYCGSQNCADPEFLVKAKYAPWVDVMIRFTGPVVRQNQHLFATDWMTESAEDIGHLLTEPLPAPEPGFAAQVIASGPTAYPAAAPEMFASLMFNARRELIVTTPYFVPVDSLQAALRAAANRGVDTTVIFPAHNDAFAVKAASQSYYEDLLRAGVRIFEYQPGLLHAKTVTVDGEVTLIGSANMDRRSFDLNYENNILFCDAAMTKAVRDRQVSYLADSRQITQQMVMNWSWRTRLWNNALAVVGPVL
ncbi:MAG: cardiolipin synthase [Rhodobacter sp.]|nr:cardiolipin synthase [Rhodobacter sp.]MCA3462040.1 cardiolipin synthase [Rhodobacter sp.]MCA3464030.1 cardiolipin synthase [Rhodobacter sp.]MCA3466223.1 cardiolipin synthase [Rhodobacter sp.]MCA3470141.1 cardiolipin synthase [Rhodobacter sp.]